MLKSLPSAFLPIHKMLLQGYRELFLQYFLVSFNPCSSLPYVATDDRKQQFQSLHMGIHPPAVSFGEDQRSDSGDGGNGD